MSSIITIAGAGVLGLACGWQLTRRGARVRVLEASRIGAGASGGVLGALAPHSPERWSPIKQIQLEGLLAAEGFWSGVAQAGGIDPGYARSGRLSLVTRPESLADRIAAATESWPAAMVPELRQGSGVWEAEGKWLHDGLSARIAPRPALTALAAAIRANGGEIVEGTAAQDADLWATGASGLDMLSADLGRVIGGPQKGQAAVLGFDAGNNAPQLYIDGLHVVPHADGRTAIGSTSERDFAAPDTTDDRLEDLIACVRAAVPALESAPVLERWAGLRPRAASRAPVLGAWPGRPEWFVANGGFKIGFGLAPWIAGAMADLILDGHDRIPQEWSLRG